MPRHIFRQLRPMGVPIILEAHYHPHTGEVTTVYEYPLSSEFGDQAPCMGEVEDFPMDSLCNQIIQKPRELTKAEIKDLGFENLK